MTEDQITQILVAIAEFKAETKAELKAIADENDKADIIHTALDTRIHSLEAKTWRMVGMLGALFGGAGVGSVLTDRLTGG